MGEDAVGGAAVCRPTLNGVYLLNTRTRAMTKFAYEKKGFCYVGHRHRARFIVIIIIWSSLLYTCISWTFHIYNTEKTRP